jgi:hypothetical protein
MREKFTIFGLAVHAETIAIAVAEANGEMRGLGTNRDSANKNTLQTIRGRKSAHPFPRN